MLGEARDMAVAAGEPALACTAVDELGKLYQLDALAMKTTALTAVAETVRGLDGQRQIARSALESAKQALDQKRIQEALELARVAEAAATKSRNLPLVQQARSAVAQLEQLKKSPK